MMDRSLEGRVKLAGYRMIESLRIENFRCFESLKLEKLRRINLIVGRNAVGKTALLEALRMAVGGVPQIASWINAVRGINTPIVNPMTREQFESLWNNFFFRLDKDRRITFTRHDSDFSDTSLEIFYDPSQPVTQIPIPPPQTSESGTSEAAAVQRVIPASAIIPLVFRRRSTTISSDLRATVLPTGQLHLEPGPQLGPASAVLGASVGYQAADNSVWFTEMVKQNRESEILELVQREYPEVKGFAVVPGMPFGSSVWVTVPYLKEKEPLTLLSAGITKFFTLILAAHFFKKGLVLVDEIENGTYYERLASLWTALHRIAVENDTQIFATTHSQECLDSILEIIRADEDQFSLIRLRRENGRTVARQFYGAAIASAIEEGIEVRGQTEQ